MTIKEETSRIEAEIKLIRSRLKDPEISDEDTAHNDIIRQRLNPLEMYLMGLEFQGNNSEVETRTEVPVAIVSIHNLFEMIEVSILKMDISVEAKDTAMSEITAAFKEFNSQIK